MEIIPAIDLRAGRVVRLKQDDYAQETHYPFDAYELVADPCKSVLDAD